MTKWACAWLLHYIWMLMDHPPYSFNKHDNDISHGGLMSIVCYPCDVFAS